ncbi:MAG: choice-of-anchor M domain-containing protein [Verrucomicrobiae bacterium]|nr:choice-of-anchor M domain-containing protein [Verrucomicrobiae bacterium]
MGFAAMLAGVTAAAHVHVQIGYGQGRWDLHVYDFDSGRSDPADVLLVVSPAARGVIADDPRYAAFLGTPGDPVWILPQHAVEGILDLGVGTSAIGPGVFANNQVRLHLEAFEGPGDFALFTTTALGAPVVSMATRDGVDAEADVLSVPAVGGHLHLNWAFTAPGRYRVLLGASGRLVATGEISRSEPVAYHFEVRLLPLRFEAVERAGRGAWVLALRGEPGMEVMFEHSAEGGPWAQWSAVPDERPRLDAAGFWQGELPLGTEGVVWVRARYSL